jgi:hypothetical protein
MEGNNRPFFSFIQSDPVRAKRYDLAMKSHSDRAGFDLCHTIQGYPWSDLGTARVVDVSHLISWGGRKLTMWSF